MRVRESVAAFGADPRLLTVQDYYRAAESGIFGPDERLELIHGQVIKMSPQGSRHASVVYILQVELSRNYQGAIVRSHSPLTLGSVSEPEPDIVVAKWRCDLYGSSHPTPEDVLLVVEVADSSLRLDRRLKTELYARFGIRDYWLIDLKAQTLEVYRRPEVNASGRGRYAVTQRLSSSDLAELPGQLGIGISLGFLSE